MSDLDAYCGDSPLWNLTLLLNSSWPRFTECFQSSILVYVPNGYLWCALVPYLPYLLFKRRGPPILATWSNAAKTIISVILSLCTMIAILTEADLGGGPKIYPTAHYVARFVEGATYLLAAVLTQIERSCGVITSGVLFFYWLILTVVDIIPLYSYILLQYYKEDLGRVLVFYVSYVLIIMQLLLHAFFADAPPEFASGACPETSATFLSRITYWWMSRLITTGFRRPLQMIDLWRLNPRDESSTVVPALERALTKAGAYSSHTDLSRANKDANSNSRDSSDETLPLLRSAERNGGTFCSMSRFHRERAPRSRMRCAPHYSLLRVLVRTYYGDVLCSYACKLCSDVLQYLSPLLLSLLITNIESPVSQPWKGYVISVLMLAVSWSQTAFYHQHFHIAMTTGMRMKTALMAAIYKKSLRLNTEGQRAATVGEVVNLMSVDCQRVQDMMSYTWMVWSIPLQVLIAVYLLWDTMGPSVLAGVGLLLLLVPVNGYLAYRQQTLQKENLQWKDRRLKIMNEIIIGIKVLKLYAWETSFQERVLGLRRKEIAVLTKLAHQNAISIFIWTCAPYLVTLATFATYVLSDVNARLDPNKAFVTLSLFNILQFPIAFVPEMISFTAQASVSIKRIDKFLKLGEIEPGVISSSSSSSSDQRQVRVERGLFTWDPTGRSTLHGSVSTVLLSSILVCLRQTPVACLL